MPQFQFILLVKPTNDVLGLQLSSFSLLLLLFLSKQHVAAGLTVSRHLSSRLSCLQLHRCLHSNLYINLSSKLERPLMELLARETLAKGSVDMISKIYDQNLEFVSLEQRLFSLDRPGSYVQYNDPRQSDHVEAYMKSMASALFGVLATVGGVPIIRALPGGPAQMMSELLSKVRG